MAKLLPFHSGLLAGVCVFRLAWGADQFLPNFSHWKTTFGGAYGLTKD